MKMLLFLQILLCIFSFAEVYFSLADSSFEAKRVSFDNVEFSPVFPSSFFSSTLFSSSGNSGGFQRSLLEKNDNVDICMSAMSNNDDDYNEKTKNKKKDKLLRNNSYMKIAGTLNIIDGDSIKASISICGDAYLIEDYVQNNKYSLNGNLKASHFSITYDDNDDDNVADHKNTNNENEESILFNDKNKKKKDDSYQNKNKTYVAFPGFSLNLNAENIYFEEDKKKEVTTSITTDAPIEISASTTSASQNVSEYTTPSYPAYSPTYTNTYPQTTTTYSDESIYDSSSSSPTSSSAVSYTDDRYYQTNEYSHESSTSDYQTNEYSHESSTSDYQTNEYSHESSTSDSSSSSSPSSSFPSSSFPSPSFPSSSFLSSSFLSSSFSSSSFPLSSSTTSSTSTSSFPSSSSLYSSPSPPFSSSATYTLPTSTSFATTTTTKYRTMTMNSHATNTLATTPSVHTPFTTTTTLATSFFPSPFNSFPTLSSNDVAHKLICEDRRKNYKYDLLGNLAAVCSCPVSIQFFHNIFMSARNDYENTNFFESRNEYILSSAFSSSNFHDYVSHRKLRETKKRKKQRKPSMLKKKSDSDNYTDDQHNDNNSKMVKKLKKIATNIASNNNKSTKNDAKLRKLLSANANINANANTSLNGGKLNLGLGGDLGMEINTTAGGGITLPFGGIWNNFSLLNIMKHMYDIDTTNSNFDDNLLIHKKILSLLLDWEVDSRKDFTNKHSDNNVNYDNDYSIIIVSFDIYNNDGFTNFFYVEQNKTLFYDFEVSIEENSYKFLPQLLNMSEDNFMVSYLKRNSLTYEDSNSNNYEKHFINSLISSSPSSTNNVKNSEETKEIYMKNSDNNFMHEENALKKKALVESKKLATVDVAIFLEKKDEANFILSALPRLSNYNNLISTKIKNNNNNKQNIDNHENTNNFQSNDNSKIFNNFGIQINFDNILFLKADACNKYIPHACTEIYNKNNAILKNMHLFHKLLSLCSNICYAECE